MTGVFGRVAVVESDSVRETLEWAPGNGAMLTGEFGGMSTTVEKTREQAQRDVRQWAERIAKGELRIVELDMGLLTRLLEGDVEDVWQSKQ